LPSPQFAPEDETYVKLMAHMTPQQACKAARAMRLLPALLAACLLHSCASAPPINDVGAAEDAMDNPANGEATGAATVAAAEGSPERATEGTTDTTPESEAIEVPVEYGQFSEDVLTRSIMAELALQRGRNQEALDIYIALVQETSNISIIQRATRLATFMRNTPLAIELGNLWLQQDPDAIDARQMLAVQLAFTGRYRESLDHMTRILEAGEEADFRLIPSRTVNDTSASLILDALIADYVAQSLRFPQSLTLKLGLAMLYEQNNQIPEAHAVIADLALEMPDNPELVIQEIQLLERLGETQRAQRRLQQSLRDHPQHKQLRFMYGRKLITELRYQEAKEQFTLLVEQDPEDFDMVYSLALLCMETGMYEEARSYWQRLLVNGQKTDEAHFYLGYILANDNRPAEAISHYLQVKGGNNHLLALRNLTELMIDDGRYAEAKAHLQNVRFRNAEYNLPLLSMEANILLEKKRYDDATVLLDSAIGAFPNNIQLLFLRSVMNQDLNNLELMETDLRRIIQLEPNSPMAYNSLGYVLADRTDRFEEAYELIQRAIELAPNDPAIIDSLGWVQYRLGMFEEARTNLERAYELFPDPEVAAHLGEVLWVLGERSAANRIWRAGLEVEPDSKFIIDAMQRLNPGASR
jgi:tetratricopeptide (TPR) repeat protein